LLTNAKIAGAVGLAGLLLTLVGVVIAFLSWQGDERERAIKPMPPTSIPTPTSASPTVSANVGASPVASGAAPVGVPDPVEEIKRTTPPPGKPTIKTPAVDAALSYHLDSSSVAAHTVSVSTSPTGRAETGMTYWFMVEVDWGGNIDYYPRRRLDARKSTFDVSIPSNADTKYARTGRVYALTGEQAAQAQILLDRQTSPTGEDDFFAEQTGRSVSNGERLPFR
jgi:hypothetical protein